MTRIPFVEKALMRLRRRGGEESRATRLVVVVRPQVDVVVFAALLRNDAPACGFKLLSVGQSVAPT